MQQEPGISDDFFYLLVQISSWILSYCKQTADLIKECVCLDTLHCCCNDVKQCGARICSREEASVFLPTYNDDITSAR